ncbi:type VI secretion system protein TssA [Ectopseudomonas mendocina]|uniref:Type VI secretion system protein TssA n=1 Tax=Ectopseudomonas mendocina TaxID=300 RepID=A0ABZ2RH06_ECTME
MTYSSKRSAHYLALAKQPINESSFAGEDVRYSAEYEALENELAKSGSVHQTTAIDWQKVIENSEALLSSQSKDLRVATWLTWGLFQRESFTGLHAGFTLVHYLCLNHWAELYPGKPRTRAAAIIWLIPRLEQTLAEHVPIGEHLSLFRSLAEQIRELEAFLSEQLGDNAPLLLPLYRRLEDLVKRASQTQAEPTVVSNAIAQVKQAATQILSPSSIIESERDAHKSLRQLQDLARPLCGYWLKQNASDLRALRLSRTLLWLPIDNLPERNGEQITSLRGIPIDKLKSYQERLLSGQYADLLVDLEASIARAPFWLDGQHLAWQCLQGMGAEHAMREVEIQLALFMQRMTGLETLRFHDGSPFADDQTRAWLITQVMPHVQNSSAEQLPSTASESAPAWDIALQQAITCLRKDGLKSAVQQIKTEMASARGERERFFWQLTLARLCYAAKKYDLARTQLEALDQLLHANGLSNWEPDLVLEVLRLRHSCCELLPQNNAVREEKDEIHRRLCHLDLEVVLD